MAYTDGTCRQTPQAAQISALTASMSNTWNRGDAHGYGELFGERSDYVAFDGTRLIGRPKNVDHHQALFETVLKGTCLQFEGTPSIRFLTEDIAIMHAMGSVLMPWHARVLPKRRSIQTYVVQRTALGEWKIEAFHNSRFRPVQLPRGLGMKLILAGMRLRSWISRVGRRSPT
jgi:uncharacterized protein (TIGR02246 family)